MTSAWEIVPMGQLCSIKSGKSDTKNAVDHGAYAFFDRSRTIKRSSRYLFDCEALIIPGEGMEFLPKHFVGKFDLHQRAYALFAFSNRIDVKFLYYFLHHLRDYFPRVAVGATVKSLRLRHFEQLPVALTGLPEQQRIVTILDEAFDAIATAKSNTEKNLQNARALFDSHLHSIFSERGAEWVEKPLISLCSLFVDSAHRTPKYQDEGIPALRPRDVVNGKVNFSSAARVSAEEYEIQSLRHRPALGDIVYSRELSYGWAAVLPELPRVCLSQGMCLFRPSHEIVTAFLLYILNSSVGRSQAISAAVGTAHPHINLGDIKAYRIPVTSLAKQRQLVQILDALSIETQRLESIYRQKLAALDALKKSLLHQAFNAQL